MNYMINPSWFYWISVADEMKTVLAIVAILSGLTALFFAMSLAYDYWCRESIACVKKWLTILSILCILFALTSVFIPSRDTLIEMQIARYATYENAEWTVEAIKGAVDYIVEAMQSLK